MRNPIPDIRRCFALLLVLAMSLSLCMIAHAAKRSTPKIPVIYCSDLFHPHADLDDHFDLACLFALKEIDIKAIILDDMADGCDQALRPGHIPIDQLNTLTGRSVPWALGSRVALETPDDIGEDNPNPDRKGVDLILKTLKAAKQPVTIITVGSVRNPVAAYNRDPKLFKQKVRRIFVFIGDARGAFTEWNVHLDPKAYARMMNSGLPVYWVPCFDGGGGVNQGNGSFWQADHTDLLKLTTDRLLNYFRYAMIQPDGAKDPIKALDESIPDAERRTVLGDRRGLWGASIFAYIAGRKYVKRDGECMAVPTSDVRKSDQLHEVFSFLPVSVYVDPETGHESIEDSARSHKVLRFHVVDLATYGQDLTSCVRHLYGELSKQIDDRKKVR